MKTEKILADEFIRLNLNKYGLNGTNTTQNPNANFPQLDNFEDFQLKYQGGVKFGYNGQKYNFRSSSTCMFWTDYGNKKIDFKDFRAELSNCLQDISKKQGKISVPYLGSPLSQIFCQILLDSKLEYQICIPTCQDSEELNFENEFNNKMNSNLNFSNNLKKIEFKKSEFIHFMNEMAQEVRCVDPLLAFSAFIGERSEIPSILHSSWPMVRDENFDTITNKPVGPCHWTVVDNESDFSTARFNMKINSNSIFNIFYFYPQIFFSILNENSFKSWLRKSSQSDSRKSNSDSFYSTFLKDQFPNLYESQSWIQACVFLKQYEMELLSKYPKANESWLTPLHRLVVIQNIKYDFEYNCSQSAYGVVFD